MGFDFDDIEAEDPSPDPDELRRQEAEQAAAEAEQAAEGLKSEAWNVRRDACKALAQMKEFAAPYMNEMLRMSKKDTDYEARTAARRAFTQLKEAGVEPVVEPEPVVEEDPEEIRRRDALQNIVVFRIFKEDLTMRLDSPNMKPVDVTEIWEKSWGIQYAGRIKMMQPIDSESEVKYLNPREDLVPRNGAVVRLDCHVGSILGSLAVAMKQFGGMTPEEAVAERERRKVQKEEANEKRAQADLRQQEERIKQERRRRRLVEGAAQEGLPWREHRLNVDPAVEAAEKEQEATRRANSGIERPWRRNLPPAAD